MRKWAWDRKWDRHERWRHAASASPQSPLMLYRLLFIGVIALLVIALAGLSSNSRDLTFGHPAAASLAGDSRSDSSGGHGSGGCASSDDSGHHKSSLTGSDDGCPSPTPSGPCDDGTSHPSSLSGSGGDDDSCPSATPTPPPPAPTPTATIGPTPPPGTVDLSVSKTGAPNPVSPGSNLTYTITVTNAGPATANGVIALDSLPGGVTFLSASASQGSCLFVTCSLGSIAPGASATITLTVKVAANTSGSVTNTACASTTSAEPNLTNNCDTTTNIVPTPTPTPPHVTPTPPNVTPTPPNVTPTPPNVTPTPPPAPQVDLVVHKVGAPNPVAPGNNLIYFITVTNLGPSPADAVVVVDTLPAGVTFVSATPSQGSCVSVNCSLGTLASGATATITVKVKVNPGTTGQITNTACVSSNTPDTNPDNNCDSTTTTVTTPTPTPTLPPGQTPTPTPGGPRADLSLIKVDSPDPVSAGRNLTYGITVTNNGPDPAPNVVVNDALPPGVTLISATPSQGTCAGATCNLGTLAPGDTAAIAVVVEVDSNADPQITNIACASSSIIDPNLANNCDDETTAVRASVTPTALPAVSTPTGPAGFPTSGGLFGDGSWGSWLLLAIGLALLTLGGGAFYLSRKRRMRLDL